MFLVAGLLGLSGCIKNEVSTEVAAIRAAQAGFITAKTAYQTSAANLKQAEADLKAAEVAAKLISNEIDRAQADEAILKAQEQMAEATLKHLAALSDLQKELDLQIGADAEEYLAAYTGAVEEVHDAKKDVWEIQEDIATLKQLLANVDIDNDGVADGKLSHEQIRLHYQNQLDAELFKLSYDSAVLSQLELLILDPAAFTTVRLNAEAKSDALENALWELERQEFEATQATDNAKDIYDALVKLKSDYEFAVDDNATKTASLKAEEDALKAFISFLTTAKAKLVTPKAKTDLQAHIDLLGSVRENISWWGVGDWIADTLANGTNGAGLQLTTYGTLKVGSVDHKLSAKTDMTTAEGALGKVTDGLLYIQNIDPRKAVIVSLGNYITANKAAYDAAVATGILEAWTAYLDALALSTQLGIEVNAAQNELDTWNQLIADLAGIAEGIGSIEEALADAQEAVATQLVKVEGLRLKLVNNDADLATVIEDIAAHEAKLVDYQLAVTKWEAIAAYYQALLDSTLG